MQMHGTNNSPVTMGAASGEDFLSRHENRRLS